MGFSVSASTLESLEWARVAQAMHAVCRTPQGQARIAAGQDDPNLLFAQTESDVHRRLAETSEARALMTGDAPPPFGACRDLETSIGLAARGGVLESSALLDVGVTLGALRETIQYFERRAEAAPTLAEAARQIEFDRPLAEQIERCLDPSGEVRDSASKPLAEARRTIRKLSSDLKSRIERALAHQDIAPHLSDAFYTVRGGRYVLPVKSDAKGQVRGIVHDASRSGTTIFVEPEAMVDLNNRHRQAELTVERETQKVLRDLSAGVARSAGGLQASLEWVGHLDWAFARAELGRLHDAVEPEIGRDGIFELPGLRHPLIPADECVANDLRVGEAFGVLLLSGPNAGGKTVALKSVALAALFVRAGLHVPANPGARVDLVDRLFADIGDHQNLAESLSTFSAAMAELAEILRRAGPHSLVCLDEVGVGTDPSEGAAIAQATLEALADAGARTVTTTHYNLLKEMAEIDARFENASVEFDPVTLAPTYRVRIGAPGASSARTVAARMGVPEAVLERAESLLSREDRRLDQMLAELAANRAELDRERAAAAQDRAESQAAREEHHDQLIRLRERRDQLFTEMREELDASFRGAHQEVARLIHELQRKPSAQKAGRVRAQLQAIESETKAQQASEGLVPKPDLPAPERGRIDWKNARVGDAVFTAGGTAATLAALPDRKNRVQVQAGGAKLSLDADQLFAARPEESSRGAASRKRKHEVPVPPPALGGIAETDLRGLRVDEALDQLESALDTAAAEGRAELRVIHGMGTGALRSAVRERLPHSPHVVESTPVPREEGGEGVTRAVLRKDD